MDITIEQISEITGIRVTVLKFAIVMEKKLKENEGKGGWENNSFDSLLELMDIEVSELKHSIRVEGSDRKIVRECADVANFAMMIADNTNRIT